MKRLLVTLAAAVAIGGLVAAPAHASVATASHSASVTTNDTGAMTAKDCAAYLDKQGYIVGPKVKKACEAGTQNPKTCTIQLTSIDVQKGHATEACKRATK